MLCGLFSAVSAEARPGYFYGPRVGVFIDPWPALYTGAYYPYGYYGYYGYPPVVAVQPAAPTVYVEQNQQGQVSQAPAQQQAAPGQSGDWYYCRKPEGYYPYVRNCTEGWQRVPAQPPAQH
jgi:hypothetical protein